MILRKRNKIRDFKLGTKFYCFLYYFWNFTGRIRWSLIIEAYHFTNVFALVG